MIGFIIGSMVGGTIGVFATCLCVAAGRADRGMDCTNFEDNF